MSNSEEYKLEFDAFIRAVKVNKNTGHSFFLGAGASITSGVKSAYDCIWDWKKEIYITKNPNVANFIKETNSQYVRDIIQDWLDKEGFYPSLDSPEEYSFFIEKAYPIDDDRRQFFQNLIENKKPYIGYQLLCLLSESELIKSVWTTNFDGLTGKAAQLTSNITSIEIGLDTVERIFRPNKIGELLLIALHGDYKYDKLKNTDEELRNQDETLRKALINYLKDHHLIISGYSGRDKSIMSALTESYTEKGTGRLYWCGFSDEPSKEIYELLQIARKNGRLAYYIPTNGFDDIVIRLSKLCLSDNLAKKAEEIYAKSEENKLNFAPFSMDVTHVNSIIKSNLFRISLPKEVFQFDSSLIKGENIWSKLKETIKNFDISAVPFNNKVYAISTITEINNAFNKSITGDIIRTPIDEKELRFSNSNILHLLKVALVKSLAKKFNLQSNERNFIWEKENFTEHIFKGITYRIYNASRLNIKIISDDKYLSLKPTIKIFSTTDEVVHEDIEKEIKKQILEKQRNKEFNDAVNHWRNKFFPENKDLIIDYPYSSSSDFKFTIYKNPAFGKVMKAGTRNGIELDSSINRLIKHKGIEYEEPKLLFSSKDGTKHLEDFHPIRGLLQNRPYDYSLTQKNILSEISLSVICPKDKSTALYNFLNKLHQEINVNVKKDYLLEYPGFSNAYGVSLKIPTLNNENWVECSILSKETDNIKLALNLAKVLTEKIDELYAKSGSKIILIFIPKEWDDFTSYKFEGEKFDLHDYLKAYAANKGIATQLIKEKTLETPSLNCQIIWWLSLSFYVKALRTPWVLKSLDKNTAFAGIGYSLDSTKDKKNILIGCSQIFNSQGEGLQYKLSKIDDFEIRQYNPYLSYDDAFRLGNSIRQMFFESMGKIPERVVIHKRTYFSDKEKKGLLDGLGEIRLIDLIELNIEDDIRYVASLIKEGKPNVDGFPVKRGTCILLNSTTALLWCHGTVPSVQNQNYKYYLGGRRIPAPLCIKKHYGVSNIGTIATEILGLSKMHWNTFDLYTQLPATIQASNEIARISALLSRFSGKTYDYRFFI